MIKYVSAKCLIGPFFQLQSKKIYFSIDVTNSKEQRPIKNRVWFQFYHYRLRHRVSITNSWKMRQWLKVASLCFLDALLAKFSEVKTLVMETAQQGFFTSMSHGSLKKNLLRDVRGELNSLSLVQKSMHTNSLGPSFALQCVCMPTNYKYGCLGNHAFAVCHLLHLCHVFQWGQ